MNNTLIYKLKNSFFIRALCCIPINIVRKRQLKLFKKTKDAEFLRGLKNTRQGQRCFIIGNGPSLRIEDLDKLKNEFTFAANGIYKVFDKTDWRPSVYMCVDPDVIKNNIKIIEKLELPIKLISTIRKKYGTADKNTAYIFEYTKFKINKWNDKTAHISLDVSKYFSVGYTVTFDAIQLAIYMGFSHIYLLGIDHSYSIKRDLNGKIVKDYTIKNYFDDRIFNYYSVFNYESSNYAYKVANEYVESHGIKIYNATRGGKLEVFERVDINSLFNK